MLLAVLLIILQKLWMVNHAAIGGTMIQENKPPKIHIASQDQPFTFLNGT